MRYPYNNLLAIRSGVFKLRKKEAAVAYIRKNITDPFSSSPRTYATMSTASFYSLAALNNISSIFW